MKALFLHLALCFASLGAASGKQGDPPAGMLNILHIHADDHRPDGLHALGNPLLQTPNLDSLVERGMTFTHCYTMGSMIGAVCTPSRTMMLTGRSWQRIPGAPARGTQRRRPRDIPAASHCGRRLSDLAHGQGGQWISGRA